MSSARSRDRLTGIPVCPDEGVHGMTIHLSEEQTTPPGRLVQVDLMRSEPTVTPIDALMVINRLNQVEVGRNELVPYLPKNHPQAQGKQAQG